MSLDAAYRFFPLEMLQRAASLSQVSILHVRPESLLMRQSVDSAMVIKQVGRGDKEGSKDFQTRVARLMSRTGQR